VTTADPSFARLKILSAYATLNGVDIFEKILRIGHAKNNAIDVFLSVGIDQKRTTYDALNRLLQLRGEFASLHVSIIHDERINHRFHPKVYNFESDTNALVFVGSSNLTRSGLTSNYEIVTVLHFDLSSTNGYPDFVASLNPYFTPATTGWVRELSWGLLSELEKKDWFAKRDEDESEREEGKAAPGLFGKGQIQVPKLDVEFTKVAQKRPPKAPEVALQLTHWDTDPRHSETQIPEDVLNNKFFPSDNLVLVFPQGSRKVAKLSHYQFHSRIYNKEILDRLKPSEGDVLILTRKSPKVFGVRLVRKGKVSSALQQKLDQKRGKGKRWGWL
jgi:hypothetical protein